MRIAFFSETFLPKVDGIVTRLRNTIVQLRRAGHEVMIFAPEGGLTEFEGARVIGMRAGPFPLYPELKLALPRTSMRKLLEEFKPDIIHAVDPALLAIAGIYYADKMKLPLVVSYHTQIPKYLHYYKLGWSEAQVWKLLRLRHNRADLNLCTSSAMVEELTSHGVERVNLWQRGIDTDTYRRDRPAAELAEMRQYLTEGNPSAPLLLYVGRLSAEKNIEELKGILAGVPGARLALVGGGPHREALERHFAGTPTFFAGYLKGDKLAQAFSAADLFTLASKTETLGLVLLEAMAAGCPVIAARAGGIPDIVTEGVNGFLYDTNEEAIGHATRLLGDVALRETIRSCARLEAERWGWAAATRQLEMYYGRAEERKLAVLEAKRNTAEAPNAMRDLAKLTTLGVIRRVLR
jgi:glycosyltransferase involved in cell wall biosynthesis